MLLGIDWSDCEVKCKGKTEKPPTKGVGAPTETLAGSLARLEVYAKRFKEGRPIFNRHDAEGYATRRDQAKMKEFINQQEEQRVLKKREDRAAKKAAKEKAKSEHQLFDTGRKRVGEIVKPSQLKPSKDRDYPDDTKAASVPESGTESKDAAIGSGR